MEDHQTDAAKVHRDRLVAEIVREDADGDFAHLPILPVAFVPLVSHPENG